VLIRQRLRQSQEHFIIQEVKNSQERTLYNKMIYNWTCGCCP